MFAWHLAHNSLAMQRKIKSKGLDVDTICPMCKRLDEDGGHFLFKCKYSKAVWRCLLLEEHMAAMAVLTSPKDVLLYILDCPEEEQVNADGDFRESSLSEGWGFIIRDALAWRSCVGWGWKLAVYHWPSSGEGYGLLASSELCVGCRHDPDRIGDRCQHHQSSLLCSQYDKAPCSLSQA
ncbi:hypothetical protein BAE44_0007690 [Dichanthelium oligosanthes]|uniref:Reverse transcriptase zinc-binding domain-containing protein n=1 Tax=Dichanthelium oligosanthes TaxID=888268 RepID=A0A1E5W204_9POAL|nr:hypothetical protein BAE44_0007690 [Dichanthelium oligosanthes]